MSKIDKFLSELINPDKFKHAVYDFLKSRGDKSK